MTQICNIAVYITHIACTIHILNLPEKTAQRDIVHGLKHLEEIAGAWLGARRTLHILALLVRRWKIELPADAQAVFSRTEQKYRQLHSAAAESPRHHGRTIPSHQMPDGPYQDAQPGTADPGPSIQSSRQVMFPPKLRRNQSQTNSFYTSNMAGGVLDSLPRVQTYSSDAYATYPATTYMDNLVNPITPSSNSLLSSPHSVNEHLQHYDDAHQWYIQDHSDLAASFSNWNNSDGDAQEQDTLLNGFLPRSMNGHTNGISNGLDHMSPITANFDSSPGWM